MLKAVLRFPRYSMITANSTMLFIIPCGLGSGHDFNLQTIEVQHQVYLHSWRCASLIDSLFLFKTFLFKNNKAE